jgi:hypothetical protein
MEKEAHNFSPFKPGALGKKIGEGSHADIHDLHSEAKTSYVVKIGKTEEYEPPLLKSLRIKLSRKKTSDLMEKFLGPQFKIYPDRDFIKSGLAEYAIIRNYFNKEDSPITTKAAEEEQDETAAVRDQIARAMEDPNDPWYQELLDIFGNVHSLARAREIFLKHRNVNFLPKEQVLIGHAPVDTSSNHNDQAGDKEIEQYPSATYYLIQEKIEGEQVAPLYSVGNNELVDHPQLLERLMTFALLTKKMYTDTGKLIDTRPEEVGKNPLEWFQKTANILLDKEKERVAFVDTRWLWDKNSALGSKGINLIDYLGVNSVDRAIKKYSDLLSVTEQRKRKSR